MFETFGRWLSRSAESRQAPAKNRLMVTYEWIVSFLQSARVNPLPGNEHWES
jgi:hypothetical protein